MIGVEENDVEIKREITAPELRTGIINSVVENGLKASANLKKEGKFHFSSVDKSPFTEIEGCVIQPMSSYQSSEGLSKALERALYADDRSVLPVVLERRIDFKGLDAFYYPNPRRGKTYYRMRADERKTAQERMCSSFLVVYRFEGQEMAHSDTDFLDEEDLSPDRIAYLVFPKDIYEEYVKDENRRKRLTTPIKVVDYIDRKIIHLKRDLFRVPNYEQALAEIIQDMNQPIWIHGVRLPTEEDVEDMKRHGALSKTNLL